MCGSVSFRGWLLAALCVALPCICAPVLAANGPITIVAAENFYGNVAAQLAGPHARVVNVLSNPDADPHLFEPSLSTAREIATADLIVYNGLDYDPWMARLASTRTRSSPYRVVVAARVLHRQAPGTNPHLWYDPATMPAVAREIAARLQRIDPAHRADYAQRLQRFLASMRRIDAKIASMRARYAGRAVAATEPVCEYLLNAIGLRTSDRRFQLAVMNNTEPSARDIARLEHELMTAAVGALIVNRQATDSSIERLVRMAREAHVPVVAVTETEPPGRTYQQWMLDELDALDRALGS